MKIGISKKIPFIVIGIVLIGVCIGMLWWNGFLLPSWVKWNTKEENIPGAKIVLKNKRLSVESNGTVFYETEERWMVSDFILSDFDEDGADEVLFLVWSHEDYGKSHPFWEKKDSFSFSQHLYIFNINSPFLERQWMSSRLRPNIKEWSVNEAQELTIVDPSDETSVWKWIGYRVERID